MLLFFFPSNFATGCPRCFQLNLSLNVVGSMVEWYRVCVWSEVCNELRRKSPVRIRLEPLIFGFQQFFFTLSSFFFTGFQYIGTKISFEQTIEFQVLVAQCGDALSQSIFRWKILGECRSSCKKAGFCNWPSLCSVFSPIFP
jgi:hypothetical protein